MHPRSCFCTCDVRGVHEPAAGLMRSRTQRARARWRQLRSSRTTAGRTGPPSWRDLKEYCACHFERQGRQHLGGSAPLTLGGSDGVDVMDEGSGELRAGRRQRKVVRAHPTVSCPRTDDASEGPEEPGSHAAHAPPLQCSPSLQAGARLRSSCGRCAPLKPCPRSPCCAASTARWELLMHPTHRHRHYARVCRPVVPRAHPPAVCHRRRKVTSC